MILPLAKTPSKQRCQRRLQLQLRLRLQLCVHFYTHLELPTQIAGKATTKHERTLGRPSADYQIPRVPLNAV